MHCLPSALHVFPQSMQISGVAFTSRKNTTYFLHLQGNLDIVLLWFAMRTLDCYSGGTTEWLSSVCVGRCVRPGRCQHQGQDSLLAVNWNLLRGQLLAPPALPPVIYLSGENTDFSVFYPLSAFRKQKMGTDQAGCF